MNHPIESGETASARSTSRIHQTRSPSSSSWKTASATSTSRNSTPARRQHSAGKPQTTPSDSESIKEYIDREIERFRKQVQERKELIRQRDNGEITRETYTLTKSLQAQRSMNNPSSSSSSQSSKSKQEKISRTICNTTKSVETGRPRSTSQSTSSAMSVDHNNNSSLEKSQPKDQSSPAKPKSSVAIKKIESIVRKATAEQQINIQKTTDQLIANTAQAIASSIIEKQYHGLREASQGLIAETSRQIGRVVAKQIKRNMKKKGSNVISE